MAMVEPEAQRDVLDLYLHEAGQYQLLSREQEVTLAKKVEEQGNKILWAVYRCDPELVINYFSEQDAKENKHKAETAQAVEAVFAGQDKKPTKRAEREFYARLETLRGLVSFVKAYFNIAETYTEKLKKEEEQILYSFIYGQKQEKKLKKIQEEKARIDPFLSAWRESREAIANHNFRFVIHLANQYARKGKVRLADCVQEGNLGLYSAIDGYDYRVGTKLSSYAGLWIRQSIDRLVANTSRSVRLPVHLQNTMYASYRAESVLRNKSGREDFSDQEVAAQVLRNAAEKRASKARRIALNGNSVQKVKPRESKEPAAEQIAAKAVKIREARVAFHESDFQGSLDEVVEGHLEPLKNLVADTSCTPEERMKQAELSALVNEVLPCLDSLDQTIIRKRFGLGGPEYTLKEIGQQHGFSRERIRQREEAALEKLKKILKAKNYHPEQ